MVTVLITSFLLLAAIIYALYWWQREATRRSAPDERALPPESGWGGLFHDEAENQKQLAIAAEAAAKEERARLLARASEGERGALVDAHAYGVAALYDEVLNRLVDEADSDKKVLVLVSYMTRETPALPVNKRLAEKFMEAWKTSPDRGSTAKMLHVLALADDASLYQKAVETALEFWREQKIRDLSAEELRSLAESEYWILSQTERSSGSGFLLKLKLAALRRELKRHTSAPR